MFTDALLSLPAAPIAPCLGFLEGIGAMELLLVAIMGLLLFGGKGLPDMARTFGRVVREFKKASANVEQEVKRVMNEEPEPPPQRRSRTPRAETPAVPAVPAPPPVPPPAPAPPTGTAPDPRSAADHP
jgi:TatA/E family protein of Tat protein translocase